MIWEDAQPCSWCGAPTNIELHTLTVSKREYYAPLYHIEQYNVGFCGPYCATPWMIAYKRTSP